MTQLKHYIRAVIPAPLLSLYHLLLACIGALVYGFPSRSLIVVGVTGTKGKTSTTEMLAAMCEAAGWRVALLNSIRIKVGTDSERNTLGRSMPGRFFIQRFLSRAKHASCNIAILEMTSEGARQYRHRGLSLDAFVFTNLAPEHIESHGSYEAYVEAKVELARQLVRSRKRPRTLVANAEDKEAHRFLSLTVEQKVPFSLSAHTPYEAGEQGGYVTFEGKKLSTQFPGEFSLRNALAAAHTARALGVPLEAIEKGLARLSTMPGRVERVAMGQPFTVIVDYAHTPDSLQALCEAYKGKRRICVLGSAGGGRDTWKRPVMGKTAEENSEVVILTNDDPYDDDPMSIIEEIASGMRQRPEILPDRREAIRRALSLARMSNVVLITGKGIDPIYGPHGTKIPWSDAEVAREELAVLLKKV